MDEYMKEEEEAVIYLKKDVNGVLAHYTWVGAQALLNFLAFEWAGDLNFHDIWFRRGNLSKLSLNLFLY
jgi:hypothetical protein